MVFIYIKHTPLSNQLMGSLHRIGSYCDTHKKLISPAKNLFVEPSQSRRHKLKTEPEQPWRPTQT